MKGKEYINKIIQGNALDVLREMPDDFVDTIVTSPPYWCYAEGHEILTENGWKDISRVERGEKVLTVNPETMELEYATVTATRKWKYKGKMIEFKNSYIDLLVTPNHRMYVYYKRLSQPVKKRQKEGGKFGESATIGYFVEAKNVKKGHITPKTGWKWKGEEPDYFILPALQATYNKQEVFYPPIRIKIEDWVAFFGIWIAEGSVRGSKGGKKKVYEITIKQKEPKASCIRELFNRLPFKFREYASKNGVITFSIVNQQIWHYLSKFGNSHTKYLPKEIKSLSPRLLRIFLKWYLMGDGHIKRKGTSREEISCYTVSAQLKDDLTEIAIKTGSNVSYQGNNKVVFLRRRTVKLGEIKQTKYYEGWIFGVEVDKNHTLCIRRNGKIVFSGNSLRNYEVEGQIGLEPTLREYIDRLLEITAELKRILKPTGVMFWNHGDSYGGSNRGTNDYREVDGLGMRPRTQYTGQQACKDKSILPKCMAMQNYRLVLRMIDEQGWILRNIIIWNKPNAMPSSVKDRFTNVYEPVFMFVKNRKYWSDLDAVRVPYSPSTIKRGKSIRQVTRDGELIYHGGNLGKPFVPVDEGRGRNPGDVWTIPTQSFPEAHFAVYPEKLVEPMLKFACPRWICKKCGHIRKRIVEKQYIPTRPGRNVGTGKSGKEIDPNQSLHTRDISKYRMKIVYKTVGWTDCGCNAGWRPGIVLDPFMGSGTTAVVARKLGCWYIGIELNPEYIEIANKRLAQLQIF